MPIFLSSVRSLRRWPVTLAKIGSVIAAGVYALGFARAANDPPPRDLMVRGAGLFAKEWLLQQVQQLVEPVSGRSRLRISRAPINGMVLSQRNAPALFGVGLIDALGEETLLSAEKQQFADFPEIRGRSNRQKDGRLGRFGWKAETPSLREFVVAACANELGLEVPGHHQGNLSPRSRSEGQGPGPDARTMRSAGDLRPAVACPA
jgi:hypothetical protein